MGLSNNALNKECLKILLSADIPLILDAGAFNIIAGSPYLFTHKKARTILTPHSKELAVLMRCTSDEVLSEPIGMAIKAAEEYDSIVVLKMNKTIIASQSGDVKISDTKNNGMATAGSGDVLSGIICAGIAYTDSIYHAACAGVYIHALSGLYAGKKYGGRYMNASDIIKSISKAHKEIFD